MTWGALEQMVDASNLSLRDHAVLRAYTRHVNPPTDQRPYPDNMIVWPSLEAVVDLSRCSQAMVQRAKHELVEQGILELVGHPGRGKTPRYRINEQKIQPDEAVLERQQQRRERRAKGSQPREGTLAQGSQGCDPFPQKGSQRYEVEVFQKSKSPEEPHFFHGVADPKSTVTPADPKKMAPDRSPPTPKTRTPAPDTLELTDALRAWVQTKTLQVDLGFQREKFLQYGRARGITNLDWDEAFKLWLLEADRRASGQRPALREPLRVLWAQVRAEEEAQDADGGEPLEWVEDPCHTPFHEGGCRTHHRRDQPCPRFAWQAPEETSDLGAVPTSERRR